MTAPVPSDPAPSTPAPLDAAPTLPEAKAALRSRMRADRRALDPARRAEEAAATAAHLWTWLGPRVAERIASGGEATVATVLPMPSEPDTAPLRERLHAAGARILVPVVEPQRRLSWAVWHPEVELATAAGLPISEPVGPRLGPSALDDAVAVVLPALAVGEDGMRLGQGGGYYDRFLIGLPSAVPTVALVFAHEVLPAGSVPAEATDRPVDGVVTADGLRWCGGDEAPGAVPRSE